MKCKISHKQNVLFDGQPRIQDAIRKLDEANQRADKARILITQLKEMLENLITETNSTTKLENEQKFQLLQLKIAEYFNLENQ